MTPRLREIQTLHTVLVLTAAAVAAITGLVSPWGVLLGGAVMAINFWLLRSIFGYLLNPARKRRSATVILLGLTKQAVIIGLLSLVFWRVDLDAVAFAVGVTILLVTCIAVAVARAPLTA
jgi:hypothetical protein